MAKDRSTTSAGATSSASDRAIARQAYNEALPYTDPRATYPRAQQYQQQVTEGVARRGGQ